MPSAYSEPLAKVASLLAVMPPSSYSASQQVVGPVDSTGLRQLLFTLSTGLNVNSSSQISGQIQYSSVSTSSSAWEYLDSVSAAIGFGTGFGDLSGVLPNRQKSIELRGESLARLPVGSAKFVRLLVTIASSASVLNDLYGDVRADCFRYPPAVLQASSSVSNVVYSTTGPLGSGTIPVV